ncbi:putative Pentatricopeptide repeat-containing protein [Quillaja saponaria]|uniref:Pentatricopeptide repeat-containing protein n=1 Tax=Quillaja saponaria TaxID=32244 RepID=A0AAD7PS69_QUISA|nr:putative Pentatricopeptide repeat-containing protein [Quillaja saponaria]
MALPVCNFIPLTPLPDPQSWNRIIKKQLQKGDAEHTILTYIKMQEIGCRADNYTFPFLFKAAGILSSSCIGYALHGQTIKTGFNNHIFVQTAILNMYASFERVDIAHKVFDIMHVKDMVAWNSMLDAYASSGLMDYAMELFDLMPLKDISSFNIMISGYAKIGRKVSARSIFDKVAVKDIVSWNSMIVACSNIGDMVEARILLDEMPKKNVITWNTMISGYLRNQLYTEAIALFDEMKDEDCKPDYLTLTGVLSACAHLGSLKLGTTIHIYAKTHGLDSNAHVTTALIDMYAKCGSIQNSLEVFYKSQIKDIYCWNAIISGVSLHGYGYAALEFFESMTRNHMRPDDITFIGLLSACSHSGLVQEGCQLFNCMQKDFGITPKIEHYGCMVDLFSRAGFLDCAFQLIDAMPLEPGSTILGALLNACVIHQDLEYGEKIMKLLTARTADLSDGEFMMFSNLYASCGLWEEANRWRTIMNDSGIVKTSGSSIVEVNGRFNKFLAGGAGSD